MTAQTAGIFLTAEWRKLIMANYAVEPEILKPFLPAYTELDQWQGHYYVSLVGFMFDKVRLKGIAVPFHTKFAEVNLRFYVRYKENGNWKRGVVFISEIVPKRAIAWVANMIYKESYQVCRMRSNRMVCDDQLTIGYEWKMHGWNKIEVVADHTPVPLVAGSKEEFITEHFWGYARKSNVLTVEYNVAHPRWDIYTVNKYTIDCDFGKLYGDPFHFLNKSKPASVFMAEGSPVTIFGRRSISAAND